MQTLATIGYESSSLEDFLATLEAAEVKALIDVREAPISRRKGFSKNALREAVEGAGINYIHLAGLGDPKEGREAARDGRFDDFLRIFSAQMETPVFKENLGEAAEIARNGGACLMCYERAHDSCHRKLVAEALSDIIDISIRPLGVRKGIGKNGGTIRPRTRHNASESATACG